MMTPRELETTVRLSRDFRLRASSRMVVPFPRKMVSPGLMSAAVASANAWTTRSAEARGSLVLGCLLSRSAGMAPPWVRWTNCCPCKKSRSRRAVSVETSNSEEMSVILMKPLVFRISMMAFLRWATVIRTPPS